MLNAPRKLVAAAGVRLIWMDNDNAAFYKELNASFHSKQIFASVPSVSLILRGQKKCRDFEGNEYTANEGEMIFLPRDVFWISDITPGNKSFQSYIFFFSERILEHFFANLPEVKNIRKQKNESRILVRQTPESILHYIQNLEKLFVSTENGKNRLLDLKLLELMQLLSDHLQSEMNNLWHPALIDHKERSIVSFMEQFYASSMTVEDFALLTGRSKSTFNREFQQIYQKSPKQWLIDRKLEDAKSLLTHNNSDVTRIAFELGYTNVSQFIKLFKRKFGVSPKQYYISNRTSHH